MAVINITHNGVKQGTNVDLNFTKSCTHCRDPLRLAKLSIDNELVVVVYTCPGCDRVYKIDYRRLAPWEPQ